MNVTIPWFRPWVFYCREPFIGIAAKSFQVQFGTSMALGASSNERRIIWIPTINQSLFPDTVTV
jgi:hypothetical protein